MRHVSNPRLAQVVQDQDDMTWKDYQPIPGTNWGDRSRPVARALKVALIAVDFEDQPFVITSNGSIRHAVPPRGH